VALSAAAADEARLRQRLRLATAGALAGIALSVSAAPDAGGVLTIASVLWLALSLHRFGRLGPDPSH
jgi:hypothetical protein